MQTFLPYPNFVESARCLDNKRLGKQRVEVLQILKANLQGPIKPDGKSTGWYNHPACRMWRGYEGNLIHYGLEVCKEWRKRGYKDTVFNKLSKLFLEKYPYITCGPPPWFENKDFHDSHKSNLLRKFPEHYKQFNWNVPDNLEYYWPV